MKINILTTITVLCFLNISVAQNYKFGKVSEEELLQKEHPADPTADAAVLYRETKTEFQYTQDAGWYMVTDYFERVKIYTKEGFDRANATIDLYKGDGQDKLLGLRGNTYYIGAEGKIEEVKLKNDGIFEEETSKYLSQTSRCPMFAKAVLLSINTPSIRLSSSTLMNSGFRKPFPLIN